ncbi:hypothetical protein FHR32_001473 [Streptosporangium album]|uniref:Uncharacterized protein n=1 Tax=Streptosporangium album TaxID=47479 RepID=A0A7W7W7S8_9ACTN|nr:hypothetical protein [Streptosporangium album]MBB4937168.1 hypothetical protein [Streptosporangium album]
MKRALVPARLRRAVRGWFDSRYISLADHRQDIRDALWEVRTLGREVTALRAEVDRLRGQVAKAGVGQERAERWDDAHRLARETAVALDGVLQNEVLLWQAVERLPGGVPPTGMTSAGTAPASLEPSSGSVA